jgi:D-sedoheptulose 7-phosphate isomerase
MRASSADAQETEMTYGSYIGAYRDRLRRSLETLDLAQVERFVEALESARRDGRRVFLFGNGGSAATASHMACDLNKGVSQGKDRAFKVLCLNDNVPTMTAWANDVAYEEIFLGQLKNFLVPGDLVVAISGSGNSPNVVRAVEWANSQGAVTVGLCGYRGGKLKEMARLVVHVDVDDMQVVEDLHLVVGHMATQALCGGVPVACVAPGPRREPI